MPDLIPMPRRCLSSRARLGAAPWLILGVALGVVGLVGCAEDPAPPPDTVALQAEWEGWTARRDTLFASESSPVPVGERGGFPGLAYYPYAEAFAASAAMVPALAPDTLYTPTTTGELRPMVRAGTLQFQAGGYPQRLVAYRPVGPLGANRLFVPFRDRTSGRETYGGGRYMDLMVGADGRVVLDFNTAYHPYCVYNVAYSCPLPPPENTLGLEVTAGERFPPGDSQAGV